EDASASVAYLGRRFAALRDLRERYCDRIFESVLSKRNARRHSEGHLNQRAAETLTVWTCDWRPIPFNPRESKCRIINRPSDVNAARGQRKRPVLGRIRGELVNDDRKHLSKRAASQ